MVSFGIGAEEAVFDEIEQRPPARFERVLGKKIAPNDRSHHWCGSKIKSRGPEHGKGRLAWIHFAKLAGQYALGNQAGKVLEKRLERFAGDPFDFGSRVHRFALNQTRIVRMCGEKIEVPVDPCAQAIAGLGVGGERRIDHFAKLTKEIFEDRAMEAALVAKVVVEHRLIGAGVGSDFVGASAGHALGGKMVLGSSKDTARRGGILDFSAS